ncbi:MAG: aldehyde dehydrogenase family protein [Trueperaceae bacterium]
MSSVKEIFETMEYGPAPEGREHADEWLQRHDRRFGHFIGGRFVQSQDGQTFETINPANGEVLAEVAQGGAADVDRAVAAAASAQVSWAGLSPHARSRFIYALARRLQRHSRLFAVIETLDNGKPIRETRDLDIPLAARHFYHHAGWAQLLGDEFPGYKPVGVCGQIIPWNFPLLMLSWKVAPALAAGCTVVLKPAEFTPLTALLLAEVARDAGLPNGVFNVVTGDGSTGELIVNHPDVDKLAFTGSTEVGRIIRKSSAGSGKKLSLELGGKSPFLVFDDADLDAAVEGVVDAIWFNQGQVCCAGSRLLVQEGVADKLHDKLRVRMETLRMGDPLDKAVDLGAIVAPVQLQRIEQLVEQGKAEGARCWQPSWAVPKEGLFYPPTLFTEVEPASLLAQVEIFGPVLASMTFRTPGEAVELANDSRYGLAASLWTENIDLALDIAPKLVAGVVWINSTNMFDAAAGFGGYRESGFGREGGREGMYEYLVPGWERDLASAPAVTGAANSAVDREDDASPLPGSGNGSGSEDEAEAALGLLPGGNGSALAGIDRTAKLYIGGKQVRPDGGYSYPVRSPEGNVVGEASLGNRKDIRNAVEAARKASGWGQSTGHNRAQILYYLAENLAARTREFEERLELMTGSKGTAARGEVDAAVERLFTYAAWADKYDGAVHHTPVRNVTLAMNEPFGIMGIVCPETSPLLAFVSLVAPTVAMGNRVVAVPSARWPLAATDLYQVLETSDVPAGVINIVTGKSDELAAVLADHDEIACLWYMGGKAGSAAVESASAGNLKATWVSNGKQRNWFDEQQSQGREYLRRSTQVKNIWVPYGE